MILLHLKLEGRRIGGERMTMDVPNGAVSYDNKGVFLTAAGRAAYSLCFDEERRNRGAAAPHRHRQ